MNSKKLKCIWCLIMLTLGIICLFKFSQLANEILESSSELSLISVSEHICDFPFPAVGICSHNQYSKKRMLKFATKISESLDVPIKNVLDDLRIIGKIYNGNVYENINLNNTERFFTKLSPENYINTLQDFYKSVSTPCSELLQTCQWKQKTYNCSELFQSRFTSHGFCCLFNYQGDDFNLQKPKKSETLCMTGMGNGLIITVNHDLEDYFYSPQYFATGVTLITFHGDEFLYYGNRNKHQNIIQMGTYNFLKIKPFKVESSNEMRTLPSFMRNCYFADELKTDFGNYSTSNCFAQVDLQFYTNSWCGCVVIAPQRLNYKLCTFADLNCLLRLLGSYFEERVKSDPSYLKMIDALKQCLPACNEINYSVSSNHIPSYIPSRLKSSNSNKSISKIYVYYIQYSGLLYQRTNVYTWFDWISSFGSLLGTFLGLSIVSLIAIATDIIFICINVVKRSIAYISSNFF